jgi:hypothetical protein
MALLAAANKGETSGGTIEVAGDGLDNKERWHWKERDLQDWVNGWLTAAFVEFDGGRLFDNGDFRARCTTIRGDYDDGGEAFLNWRKGKCFATYNFGIRLEFAGSIFVGGRSIGQSKGVLRIYDIQYDDDESADSSRPATIQGAWEVPAVGQAPPQPGEDPKTKGIRDPVAYEVTFKDAVAKSGLDVVREKIAALRRNLVDLADADKDRKGELLDPKVLAERSMQQWLDEKTPATTVKSSDGTSLSPEAIADAEQKAAEYVENLRINHRSGRFTEALNNPSATEMNLNVCDIRPGRDVADLLEALRTTPDLELLDLRDNSALNDDAVQQILLCLASGAVPKLKKVLLSGTKHSAISRNVATGLCLMRKGLVVDFGTGP